MCEICLASPGVTAQRETLWIKWNKDLNCWGVAAQGYQQWQQGGESKILTVRGFKSLKHLGTSHLFCAKVFLSKIHLLCQNCSFLVPSAAAVPCQGALGAPGNVCWVFELGENSTAAQQGLVSHNELLEQNSPLSSATGVNTDFWWHCFVISPLFGSTGLWWLPNSFRQ